MRPAARRVALQPAQAEQHEQHADRKLGRTERKRTECRAVHFRNLADPIDTAGPSGGLVLQMLGAGPSSSGR